MVSTNTSETSPSSFTVFTLSWHEYLIFGLMLAISTLAGIYYGYFKNTPKTVADYLFGNKKMTSLPIALSVAVGHFSAVTIMVHPADVYKYGAYHIYSLLSLVLIVVLSRVIYFPVLMNLQIVSVFEYIGMRFNQRTRLLACILYVIGEFILLPIVAYAPSLALSIATGINVDIISSVIFGICVFYTAVGGLKAVVWTDLFQLILIFILLGVICIVGTTLVGGFTFIWEKASEGDRFNIFDFSADLTRRDSFWVYAVGWTVHFTSYIVLHQSGLQKFLCLPSMTSCTWCLIYTAICFIFIHTVATYLGLILYAKYWNCDPVLSKQIKKNEQLLPFFVMTVVGHVPCITGGLLVALFCAAMSTLSSSLNALAGAIYKDLLSNFLKKYTREESATNILQIIVAFTGIICLCLTLVVKHLGDVVPLVASATSLALGPLMGISTLGILFPTANSNGAFYGAIGGFLLTASMAFPLKIYQYEKKFSYPSKYLSIEDCANETFISWANYSQMNNKPELNRQQPHFLFRTSHYFHTLFGVIFTIVLGLTVSYLTRSKGHTVDKRLVSPLVHRFLAEKPPRSLQNQEIQELMNRQYVLEE